MHFVSALIIVSYIPIILSEINIELSIESSSPNLVPFNHEKFLDVLGSKNSTDGKVSFASIANNESIKVVKSAVVICVDGKCVEDAKIPELDLSNNPLNASSTPRPFGTPIPVPIENSPYTIDTSVAVTIGMAVGSIGILVTATVFFKRVAFSETSSLNAQVNQKKTSKLMNVQIDWPKRNPCIIKAGLKNTDVHYVLPYQVDMKTRMESQYV
jgi:hypothetical protein